MLLLFIIIKMTLPCVRASYPSQDFKLKGYNVYGSGKTFHPDRPVNNDLGRSWSRYDNEIPGDRNMSCNGGQRKMVQ